jgi:hypothetical protein
LYTNLPGLVCVDNRLNYDAYYIQFVKNLNSNET